MLAHEQDRLIGRCAAEDEQPETAGRPCHAGQRLQGSQRVALRAGGGRDFLAVEASR